VKKIPGLTPETIKLESINAVEPFNHCSLSMIRCLDTITILKKQVEPNYEYLAQLQYQTEKAKYSQAIQNKLQQILKERAKTPTALTHGSK
jgi:hypothetical protein